MGELGDGGGGEVGCERGAGGAWGRAWRIGEHSDDVSVDQMGDSLVRGNGNLCALFCSALGEVCLLVTVVEL